MLSKLKHFFDNNIKGIAGKLFQSTEQKLQIACTALLFEMIAMDHVIEDAERQALRAAVKARFMLNDEATDELMRQAEQKSKASTDYTQFTQLINDHYEASEKANLIEILWQIAYADSNVDQREEYLVRKMCDMLEVPHATFIEMKRKVVGDI